MLPVKYDRHRFRVFGKLYYLDKSKYDRYVNINLLDEAKKYILGFHLGHDFDVDYNTEVYATDDGKVIDILNLEGFGSMLPSSKGWVMFVEHYNKKLDESYIGLYGHINPLVLKGASVIEGQLIATVGHFYSAGVYLPHLHYGYYSSSKKLDYKNLGYLNIEADIDDNRFIKDVSLLNGWHNPLLKLGG